MKGCLEQQLSKYHGEGHEDLTVAVNISLRYLSQFPVDKLKIDQSFVRNLDTTNKSIIKSIINIATSLGIEVIAGGVEEKEHLEFLVDQSCTEAQGFYFSKPVPVDEVNMVLDEIM